MKSFTATKNSRRSSRGSRPTISLVAVVLCSMALATGCVYFNTFYNARKNFNEAEDGRKNAQSRVSRSARRGGAAGSAKYRVAIEKASIVLEKHPDSKYYDDALYIIGVSYYWLGEYLKSERKFRELLANFEESEYATRSRLYLAKNKLALNERPEAVTIFQGLLETVKDDEIRAEAAFAIGDFYYEQEEYGEADVYYEQLLDSLAANDNDRRQAKIKIADGKFERFDLSPARQAYQEVLQMKPTEREEYHARFRIGECSYFLQDIETGMEMFQSLADDERYFDSLGVIRLQIARGYEMDDDLTLAMEEYEDIAVLADRSRASGAALHNLGMIYQFDLEDLDKALEYYEEAKRKGKGQNPYYEESVKRAADISALASLRAQSEEREKQLNPDSTSVSDSTEVDVVSAEERARKVIDEASEAQVRLGELYLVDLNQPDSAVSAFQYAIDSLPDGYYTPKAMLSLSIAYRDYLDDTARFEGVLEEFLERYPRSDFYPDALEALGERGSARDTGYAAKYIERAEYWLVEEENLDSALEYYQFVVDSFPRSRYTPQAEFSVTWLNDQFLNSGGDSTIYYEYLEIADMYPDDEFGKLASQQLATPTTRPRPNPRPVAVPNDTALTDTASDSLQTDTMATPEDDCSPFEESEMQLNPELRYFVGQDCQQLWEAPGVPSPREVIDYIYPSTAAGMQDVFDLYFQVKLDFDGSVLESILMNPTQYQELNEARKEQIDNLIFDMGKLGSLGYGTGWFVYKDRNTKPEYLR